MTNLRHLLSPESVRALEHDLALNIAGLYQLGLHQYRFARRLSDNSWRQRVSRLYYASYNSFRSVRLCVDGHYSQDVRDHQRFDSLPNDFPNQPMYSNRLPLLRDDRNLCDYDHTCEVDDLVESPSVWTAFVSQFVLDVKDYLDDRGVSL